MQALKLQLTQSPRLEGAMLSALGDWMDRVSRLAKVVVDARIDERHARVEEARVRLMALAFNRALDALEATAEQRATATRVLLAELRAEVEP